MWDRLFVRVFVLLFPEIKGDDVELFNYVHNEKKNATHAERSTLYSRDMKRIGLKTDSLKNIGNNNSLLSKV